MKVVTSQNVSLPNHFTLFYSHLHLHLFTPAVLGRGKHDRGVLWDTSSQLCITDVTLAACVGHRWSVYTMEIYKSGLFLSRLYTPAQHDVWHRTGLSCSPFVRKLPGAIPACTCHLLPAETPVTSRCPVYIGSP